MSAATIAAVLGGARRSASGWWSCRCPVCGALRLGLKDDGGRLAVHCFKGCPPRDILTELRRLSLLTSDSSAALPPPDPERERHQAEADGAERQRRIALARDMWLSSLPAAGAAAERYLRARLPGLGEIPEMIRYLPPRAYYARHPAGGWGWPVMVARVDHVKHGSVAVTRTWLSPDGGGRKASLKPERKFTGPAGGAAVRLAALVPDMPLLVAEGIETTLAATIATGWPGWAALSAGGIGRLILPDEARDVVIAADHDENGTGEKKARAAEQRWLAEGRQVRIFMSPRAGKDAADLLAAQAQAAWIDAAMEVRHAA